MTPRTDYGETLETHIGLNPPAPTSVGWRAFCSRGHEQNEDTVRWRLRARMHRADGRGGNQPRWERDCLLCRRESSKRYRKGKRNAGS